MFRSNVPKENKQQKKDSANSKMMQSNGKSKRLGGGKPTKTLPLAEPAVESRVFPIRDVLIKFPHKAYPSQVLLMSKVINGLISGQHCLLESPTGTGKTLALLCSALAWQVKSHEVGSNFCPNMTGKKCYCEQLRLSKSLGRSSGDRNPVKRFKCELPSEMETSRSDDSLMTEASMDQSMLETQLLDESLMTEDDDDVEELVVCDVCLNNETKRVSRIYYGTRTHKQIAQVVREFKKTEYRSVPMTILSSRERTCIHPEVSTAPNKNDRCMDKRKNRINKETNKAEESCEFYRDRDELNNHFQQFRLDDDGPWDLEELVQYGKDCNACPYYGTKVLHRFADIIFCPYNYLIDPVIRRSMEISLKNCVVIFDEAHNIEDICREAASLNVSLQEIDDLKKHFDEALSVPGLISVAVYQAVMKFQAIVEQFRSWFFETGKNIKHDLNSLNMFEDKQHEFTGAQFLERFEKFGLTAKNFQEYIKDMNAFREDNEDDQKSESENKEPKFKFNARLVSIFESILTMIGHLLEKDKKYIGDFKGVIIRRADGDNKSPFKKPKNRKFGATQRKTLTEDESFEERFVLTLNLWCFNSEISFADIKNEAHSIIVTSGTLSPTDSFSSELNVDFKNVVEASHVIQSSQIWSGIVSHGPNGIDLNCSYQNSENPRFQDEIGEVILKICQTVPQGILVFFPSYSFLNKLKKKWESTNLITKIKKYKRAFLTEPSGSIETFDRIMTEYFDTIKYYPEQGAILLAVCRGKVSEGIDFADDQARAVVTVGIPFPNYKEPQIVLKREYNDRKCIESSTFLSGSKWYEVQAFRAINQAFGRCIRHRHDWGAIILIDSRLKNQRYFNYLSKWVRAFFRPFPNFKSVQESLTEFFAKKSSIYDNDSNESFPFASLDNK